MPVAVTVIGVKVPFKHFVWAAVDWLLMFVKAFVMNAPEASLLTAAHVLVTTQ